MTLLLIIYIYCFSHDASSHDPSTVHDDPSIMVQDDPSTVHDDPSIMVQDDLSMVHDTSSHASTDHEESMDHEATR